MHEDHFSVLYCVRTVLQARRFVSRVAFGDHHAHDNVRVTLFWPFVAFAIPLHSLLWIIFLLNKKYLTPGVSCLYCWKRFHGAHVSRFLMATALAAVVWLLTPSGLIDGRQNNVSRADARPCKHNRQTAQT